MPLSLPALRPAPPPDRVGAVPPVIARAEVSHLEIRFEKPLGGSGVRQVDLVLLDLEDGDGATGLGFTYVIGGGGGIVARIAEAQAERFLKARPLLHPEALWREVAASFNRTGLGPNAVALAALDLAAWDLFARRQSLPLGVAMGGTRRAVPVYGSGGFSPDQAPEEAADIARAHLEAGLKGVKPRVTAGEGDAALLSTVRAAIGDRAALMADANEKGDAARARRLLAVAAAEGLLFVEEPLPSDDVLGYRALARAAPVAVAAGEHFQGLDRFAAALADGAAPVIQPDLAMAGGLTPCLAVARLAPAFGAAVAPHFLPGLFVQLAAAAPALRWLEDFPLLESAFEGWPEREAGALTMGQAPGHGLTVPTDTRRRCAA